MFKRCHYIIFVCLQESENMKGWGCVIQCCHYKTLSNKNKNEKSCKRA